MGGVRNALQLTEPFESFTKLGKQTGFIFYVPAYHTSKVCPATGFVNLLYPRFETVKKSQEFFSKFEAIGYEKKEDLFNFSFNYKNFTHKAEGSKQEWTIYSYGKRLVNFRNKEKGNQWDTKEIDLTNELKELFKKFKIAYEEHNNLKDEIQRQTSSEFYKQLTWILKLILQLRNSRIGTDEDWMVSPVKDQQQSNFFDSRNADDSMPQNADANGAYHIAMKGLLMLTQLSDTQETNKFKPKLDNKSWYEFIQNK